MLFERDRERERELIKSSKKKEYKEKINVTLESELFH